MRTKTARPKAPTKKPGDPVKQFSIMLTNRRGALSEILLMLKEHGILCLGLSAHDSREVSIARLVVNDPESAEKLFQEKNISFVSSDIIILSMQHAPESITQCLSTLLRAEINLNFLYPLFPAPFGNSLMALHVDDYDIARHVLSTAGFSVLYQQELSR